MIFTLVENLEMSQSEKEVESLGCSETMILTLALILVLLYVKGKISNVRFFLNSHAKLKKSKISCLQQEGRMPSVSLVSN